MQTVLKCCRFPLTFPLFVDVLDGKLYKQCLSKSGILCKINNTTVGLKKTDDALGILLGGYAFACSLTINAQSSKYYQMERVKLFTCPQFKAYPPASMQRHE